MLALENVLLYGILKILIFVHPVKIQSVSGSEGSAFKQMPSKTENEGMTLITVTSVQYGLVPITMSPSNTIMTRDTIPPGITHIKHPLPQPSNLPSVSLPTEPLALTKEDLQVCKQPKFILAPTPAQIKARLPSLITSSTEDVSQSPDTNQSCLTPDISSNKKSFFKKVIREDGMDKVLETVNFGEKFSSLPEYVPAGMNSSPSPALNLPTSPHFFVANYRKKRKISYAEDDLGSEASATPRTPRTPLTTVTTPKSTSLITGTTFFGPDFNPEVFKASEICESMSMGGSPKTPSTTGLSEGKASSLRKTLDSRRQLVIELFQEEGLFPSNQATSQFQTKHCELFPSKVCLQLKIREVRQKMMANSSTCSTPTGAVGHTPHQALIGDTLST